MDRKITRRDFLDGVALAAGSLAVGLGATRAAVSDASLYPPARTGMRGQDGHSFAVMHALRDHNLASVVMGAPIETGETYDLVVVGGGISGLAAAFLYRQQAGGKSRILILENCDDFGGHARRNEFTARNGRRIIGFGGSQSLHAPSFFSPAVIQLLRDIGVDIDKFATYYDQDWAERYGLGAGIFFRKELFGADRLVKQTELAVDWVPKTPLNAKAKHDLIELIDAPRNFLHGRTRAEIFKILSETTYADFLTRFCGCDPQLVVFFQNSTEGYLGVGIDAVTALDAWGDGKPGFDGMDLGEDAHNSMSASSRRSLTDPDPYIFHFPDGNAGVARALVRALIPGALPGRGMESLVVTPVDYGRLDVEGSRVRLRLNAPVVSVAHVGRPEAAKSVRLSYVEGGRLKTVEAAHVVLACWHRVIPHIARELSFDQVEALNDQQKVPVVLANVVISNWQALAKLGIRGFKSPSSFWHGAAMDFPVSVGSYKFSASPEEPVLLWLAKIPLASKRGLSAREQSLAGRRMLARLTFEEMEYEIRDLLGRALAGGDFEPRRDIEAITINRWAHGYAREYLRPWDRFWPDGKLPIEMARKSWGRIAVANADSGAYPYANGAIDQAARAVRDLLGHPTGLPAFADFPGPPRRMIGLK